MDLFARLSVQNIAVLGVTTIFCFLIYGLVYQIVYYRFFHPLAKFPGPFWASVSRIWLVYQDLKGSRFKGGIVELFRELFKKNGPVVRISPTLLMVSEATALPEVYHRQAQKSPQYITGFFGETANLFNTQDWKAHAHLRKIVAGPYSFSNVKKLEPIIDDRIQSWIERVGQKFADTGERFDFALWSTFLIADVSAEFGFGKPFGFIKAGFDLGHLIQSWHDGLPIHSFLGRLYPLTAFLKRTWLRKYLVASPEQTYGIGVLMKFRDDIINERVRDMRTGKLNPDARLDLLQHFLDVRDDAGKPLELEQVKAEALLVIVAGADTTATAFAAVVYHLLTNPRVYAKMMEEINAATAAGHLAPVPAYEQITKHCPYYAAIIKETLRLSPPAPQIWGRTVSPGGLTIAGMGIPAGTDIVCDPWIVQRDPGIYGDDADMFRPERWLESEEKSKLYQKYAVTFGYGTRSCLGKDLAAMELHKAPLAFFRAFEIDIENEDEPGQLFLKATITWYEDFWMRIRHRAVAC